MPKLIALAAAALLAVAAPAVNSATRASDAGKTRHADSVSHAHGQPGSPTAGSDPKALGRESAVYLAGSAGPLATIARESS